MTAKKDLKRRVRDRQARTGESYAAARARVVEAAPAAAAPAPAPSPDAIPVEEMIDLTEDAARLGLKCQVTMTALLAARVAPIRAIERIRDALLATLDDPATRIMRAVVLHGERPELPRTLRFHDILDEAQLFLARARAGIGGISQHGTLLALHVDSPTGALLMVSQVWFRAIPPFRNELRLVLTTPDAIGTGPDSLWSLLR